jgi:UPF0755 protein
MKRSRLSLILILTLVTLTCLALLYMAGIPLNIPKYAEEIYGPPSDTLRLQDKLYLSVFVILDKSELTTPGNTFGEDVSLQVELGESPLSVINKLSDLGLINDPEAFRHYLVYSGIDTQIQAGEYRLNPHMTPIEIAYALQDSTPTHTDFFVLAGWRAEEISESLQYAGLTITPDEYLASVIRNDSEGYLLPGVYNLPRDISAELLVQTTVNAFNAALTPEIKAGFVQGGFSIHEAVILASIIERETVVDDEMPMIASVFINRLNIGMKLDADPTVQYAIGYNSSQDTWWTNPLSYSDLEVESPFNTYRYAGLPPGPICNPGLNALRAVAFPAQTPYYYFRATCDNSGRHLFAETFEEHKGNSCP